MEGEKSPLLPAWLIDVVLSTVYVTIAHIIQQVCNLRYRRSAVLLNGYLVS